MSAIVLTSETLIGTPAPGNIEYNGQFFGTDSNASRAQLQRIVRGTAVASTSGTSIDFTGLPAWVNRITVMFQNLSAAGVNSRLLIQIGDSGGIENTGYNSTSAYSTGSAGTSNSETTGYVLDNGGGQPSLFVTGTAVITLLDSSTNLWVATHMAELTVGYTMFGGGRKTLSGTLDRVRITSVNGTNTFDSGSINIMYEG